MVQQTQQLGFSPQGKSPTSIISTIAHAICNTLHHFLAISPLCKTSYSYNISGVHEMHGQIAPSHWPTGTHNTILYPSDSWKFAYKTLVAR